MRNQTLIGIVAGAAAIVVAGSLFKKKRDKAASRETAARNQEYKGKLNSLQRKAQRELRDADDGSNPAVDRVNQWVNAPH